MSLLYRSLPLGSIVTWYSGNRDMLELWIWTVQVITDKNIFQKLRQWTHIYIVIHLNTKCLSIGVNSLSCHLFFPVAFLSPQLFGFEVTLVCGVKHACSRLSICVSTHAHTYSVPFSADAPVFAEPMHTRGPLLITQPRCTTLQRRAWQKMFYVWSQSMGEKRNLTQNITFVDDLSRERIEPSPQWYLAPDGQSEHNLSTPFEHSSNFTTN